MLAKLFLLLFLSAPLYAGSGFQYFEKAVFHSGGKIEVSCVHGAKRWKQTMDYNRFRSGDFCLESKWLSSGVYTSKQIDKCYLRAEIFYAKNTIKEVKVSGLKSCKKIAFAAGVYSCHQEKCTNQNGNVLAIFSNKIQLQLNNKAINFDFATTGEIVKLGNTTLDMAYIPSGDLQLGSPTRELGRSYAEGLSPTRISSGFLMQKFELNQKQWSQIIKNHKFGYVSCPEVINGGKYCSKYPMTYVPWKKIQDYIIDLNKKLNPKLNCGNLHTTNGYAKARKTAGCFRLPTEAEWEHAARAGSNKSHGLPVSVNKNNAQSFMNVESTTLKPVGSYPYANLWGLYDMHGNAQEYVQDHYKKRLPAGTGSARQVDPLIFDVTEKQAKNLRLWKNQVVKGGDYQYGFDRARSASRESYYSDYKRLRTGFRLARTL